MEVNIIYFPWQVASFLTFVLSGMVEELYGIHWINMNFWVLIPIATRDWYPVVGSTHTKLSLFSLSHICTCCSIRLQIKLVHHLSLSLSLYLSLFTLSPHWSLKFHKPLAWKHGITSKWHLETLCPLSSIAYLL